MKIKNLALPGVKLIDLQCFEDPRGYFVERFNAEKLREVLPTVNFVQDNHSYSIPRVLRGLHFQKGQGKLVTVIRGSIYDVAVDIRRDSKTFGQYVGVELSAKQAQLLWLPDGFAHGFCVLGDESADVVYKVTSIYNPNLESGIFWADKDLGVNWPIKNVIVSERDKKLESFSAYQSAT